MNIPAYQKTDYSYLPQAFQQMGQGFGQVGQGLSAAFDLGEKERKRAREEEFLADLKIQRQDAEKVRETAIVEYAAEIHEAMGLPDTEEGYGRAHDMAAQEIYPFFGDEKQDPGKGVKRVWDQEQKREERLNKLKMNRFREDFQNGTVEEQIPQRQPIQEPVGAVGVEAEPGEVKKPLTTAPQSLQELQQRADREMIEQPQLQPTVTRERTPDDFYRLGVELGITEQPEFKSLVSTLSRQNIMRKERDKPITQHQYATEALAEPVVPESTLVGKLPSEMSEAERERLKIDKMRAQRPTAGTDQTSKDIREETKRYDKISSEILRYTEKVNRLRQARVRLESGKGLDEKTILALTGVVTNPENPDINEINSEIDKLQMYTEGLKESQQEARDRITQLGKGKSLAKVVTGEAEKKQKLAKEASDYIKKNIAQVSSRATTTDKILELLPSIYRKAMKEKIDEMKGRGVRDDRIADMLLGR
jgi:hypothetical protein